MISAGFHEGLRVIRILEEPPRGCGTADARLKLPRYLSGASLGFSTRNGSVADIRVSLGAKLPVEAPPLEHGLA